MFGSSGATVGIVIGVIVGVFVIFLVCRELMCWYYKINKIVTLMEEQNLLINRLLNNGGATVTKSGDTWVCKKCNEKHPIDKEFCQNCGEHK